MEPEEAFDIVEKLIKAEHDTIDPEMIAVAIQLSMHRYLGPKDLTELTVSDVVDQDGKLSEDLPPNICDYVNRIKKQHPNKGGGLPLFPNKDGSKFYEKKLQRHLKLAEKLYKKNNKSHSNMTWTFGTFKKAGLKYYYEKHSLAWAAWWAGISKRSAWDSITDQITPAGIKKPKEGTYGWFVDRCMEVYKGEWDKLSKEEINRRHRDFLAKLDNSNKFVKEKAGDLKKMMEDALTERGLKK